MMNTRSIIASFLTTVLLAGLVVSPLAHYSWMAAGGHFEEGGQHHGHSSQEGHPAPVSQDELAQYHLTCDYSGLFATTSAVVVSSGEYVIEPLSEWVGTPPCTVLLSTDGPHVFGPRGPPQA